MGVKSVYLVDQTGLFKIGNLVYGGREIVLNMYSSLQGQRQTVYDGYGKLVGLTFVGVKIYVLTHSRTQPAVRRLRHRCLLLVILAFCQ